MKYTKKLEDSIYNLIKKENPTFEHLSRTLNISYDELKEYMTTDEYVEEIARDKLGLVKDNEIVFREEE